MKYINGKYYGVYKEIDDVNNAEDLAIFNCLDTGVQYRFFEGKWYKQPVYWTDKDDIDGGSDLPAVTASDNGDVLTVVDGAWDKAAPSGGDSLPSVTSADNGKVLGVVSGEWDKMDKGWNFTETQLFSETVTTEPDEYGNYAQLDYIQFIDYPILKVTFDGVEYTCPKIIYENSNIRANGYGAPASDSGSDFSEYPFAIDSYSENSSVINSLSTEVAGTHTISVIGMAPVISPEFEAVLRSPAMKDTLEIIPGRTTYTEAHNAFLQGKAVFIAVDAATKALALYFGDDTTDPDLKKVVGVRVGEDASITYMALSANPEEDDILR